MMRDAGPIATIAGNPWGAVVEPEGHRDLSMLGRDDVTRALGERGALLFRGFDLDYDAFRLFTRRFSPRFLVHGSYLRQPVGEDPTVQTVDVGNGPLALHRELSYLPLAPDLLWFYCVSPAPEGGETLLADGRLLLDRLSAPTRALFSTRRLRYAHRTSRAVWQVFFGESVGGATQALQRLSEAADFHFRFVEEGGEEILCSEYLTSAITTTEGGHAFANSILVSVPGSTNDQVRRHYVLTLEDGSVIPDEVVAEVRAAAEEITVALAMQAQDLILIDNARVMHGRRAFTGSERRIYTRFGVAAPPRAA